jgi:hypothetical protein
MGHLLKDVNDFDKLAPRVLAVLAQKVEDRHGPRSKNRAFQEDQKQRSRLPASKENVAPPLPRMTDRRVEGPVSSACG